MTARPTATQAPSSRETATRTRLAPSSTTDIVGRKRLLRAIHRLGLSGLLASVALLALVTAALTAPLLAPYSPAAQDITNALSGPSAAHPLGADEFGRDLLSRLLYGARPTLITAILSSLIAAVIGTGLGLIAGFHGSWRDTLLMRLMDLLLGIPGILLAMVVIAIGGRGPLTVVIAIATVGIPIFARIARAGTLAEKELEYVTAAKAIGAGPRYILLRTILPNLTASISVQAIVFAATAVLIEAGLSFLGLGLPPPTPTWGGMLLDSKSYLSQTPWYGLFPGVALSITVLSVDTLGRVLARLQSVQLDRRIL